MGKLSCIEQYIKEKTYSFIEASMLKLTKIIKINRPGGRTICHVKFNDPLKTFGNPGEAMTPFVEQVHSEQFFAVGHCSFNI